jgi:hypothetical protein
MSSDPKNHPQVPREERDEEGDATPHWAELPQLDIRDQASMSMAIRFPPLPTVPPEAVSEAEKSPDFVVVRDEFAALRQLEKLQGSSPRSDESGSPLVYGIVVRNTTSVPIYEVRVEHDLPAGVRYLGSDPPARVLGRRLVWDVGVFEPGNKQRFKISAQPNRPDSVTPESRADFRIYQCLHNQTRLLRPQVGLRINLPATAAVGEAITLQLEATNSGLGSADDVRLVVVVPQGLRHSQGAVLQFTRDRLGPREQWQAQATLHAESAGKWTVQAHCLGNGKVMASNSAIVQVRKPAHSLSAEPQPTEETCFLLGVGDRLLAVPLARMIEVHRGGSSNGERQVIDLRQRMGLPPGGFPGRIVLVRDGSGRPAAIRVDRTLGVVHLTRTHGEASHDGQAVAFLDIDTLLNPAEEARTAVPMGGTTPARSS